ncbi:MAG: pyridoxamine 5'-phosphate oxidase family protein [Polyangiaceae bacterium]|nr:pyridoxamine 5'-phosphate oxidase family protein [Polyangiaceae bacterium]MBK8942433.1 pyridoxamine 5'-phosphate oxidase family protein [Polyangiaceae bacterium]
MRFLRGARHGVVASTAADGEPQAAVVGLAVTDALELVFDTLGTTRKAANLRRDGRAAVVFTRGTATAQLEGVADEPTGPELERLLEVYYDAFPDGRERATWPGITWFRVRPTWVRTTDFGAEPPAVTELSGDGLRT